MECGPAEVRAASRRRADSSRWLSSPLARTFAARTVLFSLLFFLYSPPAHAYIDPGTGSALIYIVTGLIVSAYFAARGLYYKLVELFFRVRFKNQKCHLAIHSEDPRYETTFLPVIRALSEQKTPLTYFTMYERDGSFEPLPPQVTHQSIPRGLVGYSYLNHLEAKMLVTTTPQLDVMTFRRSKRVKHYCHVPHALGESRFVRPFAYDFFDSVFCCGKLLKENIRRIESIRKLGEKRLFETGIPHYDELAKQMTTAEAGGGPRTVLIAPSWGPFSLFQVFGTGFVRGVAERYRVIVRPHPQMKLSQPRLYEEILAMKGVEVDSGPTPSAAMSRADLLVSDISGIMYEFAFIWEKPVIVVDYDKVSIGGLEGHLLGDVVTLRQLCSDFIVGLPQAEIDRLGEKIDAVLGRPVAGRVAEVRDDVVYNFGRASVVAAQQIDEVLRCL